VIHADKLTHVNFAFARIDASGRVRLDGENEAASLAKLVSLKQTHPALRVLISVGGWMAEGFSDASSTEASRAVFVASAIGLLRQHRLDGIDLDWEYPGQGVAGIKFRSEDKRNFTLLLKALREGLDAESAARSRPASERYLLTIASTNREYFEHTEMDKVHFYLDWINIMSYDFFNSLTPVTGHHAGLYRSRRAAATDRNADAAVSEHLASGIPSRKLVLGVAFYGRSFAGTTPLNHGLDQPYERYDTDHSYAELADQFIGRQGFVRYWDDRAKAPYLWNAASRTFVSYEDPRSIEIKRRYAVRRGLGGMMFWELSQDRNDELLNAIKDRASTRPMGLRDRGLQLKQ
jgi:chitinase